jgi:hypothetical protein
MSMSTMNFIGEIAFARSYDLVVDNTTLPGYIFYGMAKRSKENAKANTAEAKWCIIRAKVTNANQLYWWRWAVGCEDFQFTEVWNSNGLDDVYNGTATF